ncbi:hypothetical protein G8S49_06200 [Clostridium botulinum C]|uniref:Uncharacterized protein n=2 Tax=Clostridium botulinum TaxID=1491 RepID=A0A9P2LKD9_CLOBO|nr:MULTISPECIES: hypothetical protein [Clostridium]EES90355.1 hypothetical protein CLG_B2292 [Clostridium phage D-1873]MCD3194780.1 hypothetical protein [Clostridium botulinum C]MCD3200285.1 hypothetical protein [Clostridium botulinum C]MCD3205648.1 hypothetical protein [Clostridium botulinum C]MCD3207517.1 hypothetical protein [Clostridium botulinum C]
MKNNIIIVKNNNSILISNNGKKLVIKDELFNNLKDKTKDEIKKWYLER